MNIFLLDSNPTLAAQYHCDKHVVKMCLETAQILCTALHLNGVDSDLIPYRKTHQHHPCVKWASESKSNFEYLIGFGRELCKEYQFRYNKVHKCLGVINKVAEYSNSINDIGLTTFPQAMPDEYKSEDAIQAYREYYKNDKKDLLTYTKRCKPMWV